MRRAINAASSAPPMSSTMTVNSSPPRRETVIDSCGCTPTVSTLRRQSVRVCATCCSSRSPTSCPRLSLTTLKRSRSRNINPSTRPLRLARFMPSRRRSRNSTRFGRPVRLSKFASIAMRSCAARRSVMSRTNAIICAAPLKFDSLTVTSTGNVAPSASLATVSCRPVGNGAPSGAPGTGSINSVSRIPTTAVGSRVNNWPAAGLHDSTEPSSEKVMMPSIEFSNTMRSRSSVSWRGFGSARSGALAAPDFTEARSSARARAANRPATTAAMSIVATAGRSEWLTFASPTFTPSAIATAVWVVVGHAG